MENCELCGFKNPKGATTAIIIKDNKLLLVKRNEEPFKGKWDLPGGYMSENETPEQTIKREMKEELGVEITSLTHLKTLPGTSEWKNEKFPVLGIFFLVEINGDIKLAESENSDFQFVPLKDINPDDISYDSNQVMVKWLKENFTFDMARVHELTRQLDSSAVVHEQSLYKAMLDGFVSKIYDNDVLVGMGWIFPRQTMLRRQAVVEDMIVDESQRGKGYGQKMLLELLEWAKKENMDMVELTSNPIRVPANELYKKVGFKLHPTNHYLYKV